MAANVKIITNASECPTGICGLDLEIHRAVNAVLCGQCAHIGRRQLLTSYVRNFIGLVLFELGRPNAKSFGATAVRV